MITVERLLQNLKALLSKYEHIGKSTCFKEQHELNAYALIDKHDGMLIIDNEEQL
jgi:hypothetical protein